MENDRFRVYRYRWVNLIFQGLLGFGMAFALIAPSVLVASVTKEWSVSFSQSTLALVLLGGLAAGIFGLPAGIASNKWGYRLPLMCGASVASIGLLLRGTASTWNMFLVYNALLAIGAGFTMSGIGTLIRKWFPLEEIGQANGLNMMMAPVGGGIGMLIAFPLVETFGWEQMWMIIGIVYTGITVLGWIFLREKPPSPPASVPPAPVKAESGFLKETKKIMNQTNILLQFVLIAVIGMISMAPALLPVVLGAQNIPANTIGVVLAVYSLVGLPVMALIPGWAFRKGLAKLTMTLGLFVAGLCFITIFYLPPGGENVLLITILIMIVGVAVAAIIPIAMSIMMVQPGVEPGNVGILSGMVMSVMGFGRVLIPLVVGMLVDNVGMTAGAWVLTSLLLMAGFVLVRFIPKDNPAPQVVVVAAD